MNTGLEEATSIAIEAFKKVVNSGAGIEVEELEVDQATGHIYVTIGYWDRDNMPELSVQEIGQGILKGRKYERPDFLNPWRRKYKRIDVDPDMGQAVSIKMFSPQLGVS